MKKKRLMIDIAMTVLLPLLMAYSLIGEVFHEAAGTLMFLLFICHNWINRGFWKGLFQGRYHFQRIFQTVINILLLCVMVLQPLSGIAISGHLFTFLPSIGISAAARQVHLVLAYWGFLFMSIHAGIHIKAAVNRFREKANYAIKNSAIAVVFVIAGYGVYAFIKRQIPDYMFMKMLFAFFDYGESPIYFLLDYLAVMVLFMLVGYLLSDGLGKWERRRNRQAR